MAPTPTCDSPASPGFAGSSPARLGPRLPRNLPLGAGLAEANSGKSGSGLKHTQKMGPRSQAGPSPRPSGLGSVEHRYHGLFSSLSLTHGFQSSTGVVYMYGGRRIYIYIYVYIYIYICARGIRRAQPPTYMDPTRRPPELALTLCYETHRRFVD